MIKDTYQTIKNDTTGLYKEKGSKFIAYARNISSLEEVQAFLVYVKGEHPKARHHCYAYRIGMNKQENYRANDDGEPSGTAGRPIIGQIDSHGLTNIMVIVVRYFGGTKLGVPGLIRSYKTATIDVFQNAEMITKTIKNFYQLSFDYIQMNKVMKFIKQNNINIIKQFYEDSCRLDIDISLSKSEGFIEELTKIDTLVAKYLYTV